MNSSSWKFRIENYNCIGCPISPEQDGFDAWKFTIPSGSGKVGYISCNHTKPLANRIQASFGISGPDVTTFLDGKEPFNTATSANVGFCISTSDFYGEFSRWWSKRRIRLIDILNYSISFECSLTDLTQWQNVNGKSADLYPTEFQNAKKSPAQIHVTFGAGGDFGHGIYSDNNSTIFRASNIKLT